MNMSRATKDWAGREVADADPESHLRKSLESSARLPHEAGCEQCVSLNQSASTSSTRGRSLCVKLDREEEREGLLEKLQAEGGVVIDGVRHQIDGIESFCITPLRKGMEIGLRVVSDE